MTGWQLGGFLLCVVVASCTQAITGFAIALVLLGLTGLFQLAPLPDAANVATVLSLASAAIALRSARRLVDWRALRATVSGTVVGVPLGVALLAWLHANVVMALRLLLGLVVIACAIVVLVRSKPLAQRSPPASFGAIGVLSGLLGGLFSASGPPLVYQFYRQPMDVDTVRDTLVAVLACGSALRLAMVVGSGHFSLHSLELSALSVPLAMGITWWMRKRPPPWSREVVLKIVCALLVVTGVGLIGPALSALRG
ncbi:sulfite exporter TauE/SafE family protein [Ramlibacter ginsenosidimutans]|uniref:Probable membrane transporter protein n=1 Tax=Ramlibacter ginsenosidimutans TaxID=502333 RepID=A0A934TUX8_9BURK|nr:sulfite exporter TauE/SafE family protein [Ramlibacter ginsenosidimutans]MBK6007886.1 sulfite exporter TauE/SafE family protein [Ramlibacter ginsenosidimutans]